MNKLQPQQLPRRPSLSLDDSRQVSNAQAQAKGKTVTIGKKDLIGTQKISEIKDKRKKLLQHLAKLETQMKAIEQQEKNSLTNNQKRDSNTAQAMKFSSTNPNTINNSNLYQNEEDPSVKAIILVRKMNEQRRQRQIKASQELNALKAAAVAIQAQQATPVILKQHELQKQKKTQQRAQLNRIVRERVQVRTFLSHFLKQIVSNAVETSILNNPPPPTQSTLFTMSQSPVRRKYKNSPRTDNGPVPKPQGRPQVVLKLDPVHHVYPKAKFLVDEEKRKKQVEQLASQQRLKSISVRKRFSRLPVVIKQTIPKEKSVEPTQDVDNTHARTTTQKSDKKSKIADDSSRIRRVSEASLGSQLTPVSGVVQISLTPPKRQKIGLVTNIVDISVTNNSNLDKQQENNQQKVDQKMIEIGVGDQEVQQQDVIKEQQVKKVDMTSEDRQRKELVDEIERREAEEMDSQHSFIPADKFLHPRQGDKTPQKQDEQTSNTIHPQQPSKAPESSFEQLFMRQFQTDPNQFQIFYNMFSQTNNSV